MNVAIRKEKSEFLLPSTCYFDVNEFLTRHTRLTMNHLPFWELTESNMNTVKDQIHYKQKTLSSKGEWQVTGEGAT
jgi:hypothetical protein